MLRFPPLLLPRDATTAAQLEFSVVLYYSALPRTRLLLPSLPATQRATMRRTRRRAPRCSAQQGASAARVMKHVEQQERENFAGAARKIGDRKEADANAARNAFDGGHAAQPVMPFVLPREHAIFAAMPLFLSGYARIRFTRALRKPRRATPAAACRARQAPPFRNEDTTPHYAHYARAFTY